MKQLTPSGSFPEPHEDNCHVAVVDNSLPTQKILLQVSLEISSSADSQPAIQHYRLGIQLSHWLLETERKRKHLEFSGQL